MNVKRFVEITERIAALLALPMPEIFNGSYTAKTPPRTPGHDPPVDFLLQSNGMDPERFTISTPISVQKLQMALSTPAPLRVLRSCQSERTRQVVGEGVRSCPRAGCGKSACPVR